MYASAFAVSARFAAAGVMSARSVRGRARAAMCRE
jgi:hypothetical protein